MDLWPTHVYRTEADARGQAQAVTSEAIRQALASQQRGFPAVLTLNHLAAHTQTPYKKLRAFVEGRTDPYRTFRLRKRSGGSRLICVPDPPLLQVQRWIAINILGKATPHPASTAYAPGSSILRCAEVHCGCQWLLKVDVQRFFESISEIQVYRVFSVLGYNELVSFEMSRLCTRRYSKTKRVNRRVWQRGKQHSIVGYRGGNQIGHLPQGAPTSPMLANLAVSDLDAALTTLAGGMGFTYTRYADDLAFSSGDRSVTRETVLQLYGEACKALRRVGLAPNLRKTVIAPPGARKIVLGLLVDRERPRLQKEFRDRLLLHAYFLSTRGPSNHAVERGFRSVWSMQRHVMGLLSFASQVDPEFAARVQSSLAEVEWGPLAP